MKLQDEIESDSDVEEETNIEDIESLDEGELNTSKSLHKGFVLEKADRSLSELHRWYQSGRIYLDPEWQRNYVWDSSRASRLIESFLLDIPVPVVYFAKNESGNYEVIDGLQRLTSVFNFFDNKFKLQKLDILIEHKGKDYRSLPDEVQNKLQDAILRSFELSDSDGAIHFVVFERLNTGGVKLNDMEIRNCLYRGSLNNLIKSLAENENFRKAINQRNFEKRMQDRALVLRFLAFYERTHLRCSSGLKRFLNDFLDTYRDASDEKISEYRKVFERCMKACLTVFGGYSFRLKKDIAKLGSGSPGEWSTRTNAAIFQVIATSFSDYDLGQITQKSDSIYETYLDLINTDPEWVDRVRRATGESARLNSVFEKWRERLKEVMNDSQPQDGQRVFSRQLKKEMFDTNPICSICGNRISLIDDAALDHDQKYWLGGKTIPENANLTHRLCNLKKG